MLRVVVAYTSIPGDADEALRQFAPDAERVDVSGSDEAYAALFCELWSAGEDFALIEHDIVIGEDTLPTLEQCENVWCRSRAFQCVRFRAELMAATPQLADELRGEHWTRVDNRMNALLAKHAPEVQPCLHEITATDSVTRMPNLIERARAWSRASSRSELLFGLYLMMSLYYAGERSEGIRLGRRILDVAGDQLEEHGWQVEMMRWLGRMLIETGQLGEAMSITEQAVEIDPSHPLPRLTAAEALWLLAQDPQMRARALSEMLNHLAPLLKLGLAEMDAFGGVGSDAWRPRWYGALASAELGDPARACELVEPLLASPARSDETMMRGQPEIRRARQRWSHGERHTPVWLIPTTPQSRALTLARGLPGYIAVG